MSMEKNSQKIETSASVKAFCLVFKIQAQLLKTFHTLAIQTPKRKGVSQALSTENPCSKEEGNTSYMVIWKTGL